MSLELIYADRQGNWSPVDLGTNVLRLGGWSVVQSAQMGHAGQSTLVLDDLSGNIGHSGDQIVGLKIFRISELSAPSGNQVTFAGYTSDRDYSSELSLITGEAVRISVSLNDSNELGNFFIVDPNDGGDRPQETVGARLTWILSVFAGRDTTLNDNGLVVYPTTLIDAHNYGGQAYADVLDDCAQQVGYNWFIYWDETQAAGNEASLGFFNPNTSTLYSSDLRLSNILSEVDSSVQGGVGATQTWAAIAPTLKRSPQTVSTRAIVPWSGGTVVVQRSATAVTYGAIDTVTADANITTATSAVARANRFLWESSTEEDSITVSVDLPAANVNDVREGQRIQAKFRQLPGYKSSFTWFRVLQRTVGQQEPTDELYRVELLLSPQEAAQPTCDYPLTAAGTYYALGGTTATSTSNPSDGVTYYLKSGIFHPTYPDAGYNPPNNWVFPIFNAGGVGTIDYAGVNAGNELRFIITGNGTLVITTTTYLGAARSLTCYLARQTIAGDYNEATFSSTVVATQDSGTNFTVTITGADPPLCDSIIKIVDAGSGAGIKFGFSHAVWTPA